MSRKRANTADKQEKTKEEKEQELFLIMKDAVNIGMSIMDSYFDKIDPKKQRDGEDGYDEDKDAAQPDSDDETAAAYANEAAADVVIYESKDPYVLHNLPFIIGTQLYLESDDVGLKDLESEAEDDQEEEEESSSSEESSEQSSDEEDEESDAPPARKPDKAKQKDMFAASDDDDDDLFKSDKKNVNFIIPYIKNPLMPKTYYVQN